MPCDTIQRSTVKLELKADNKMFLKLALESLGFSLRYQGDANAMRRGDAETLVGFYKSGVTGTFLANGQLKLEGQTYDVNKFDINAIKRAYSIAVVQAAAQQFGWELNTTDGLTFEVKKDTFEQSFEGGF
jgi:hypothetical protein